MSEVYSKKTPAESHGWGKPIILWKQAGNIIVSFSAVTQRRHTRSDLTMTFTTNVAVITHNSGAKPPQVYFRHSFHIHKPPMMSSA